MLIHPSDPYGVHPAVPLNHEPVQKETFPCLSYHSYSSQKCTSGELRDPVLLFLHFKI